MIRYVIVSFLNIPEISTFRRSNWPFHLTVLGNFYSDSTYDEIEESFVKAAESIKSIKIPVKSKEMFGPNHDIPVTELIRTVEVFNIHKMLLNSLEPIIRLKRPFENGDKYRPHVTDQEGKEMDSTAESP